MLQQKTKIKYPQDQSLCDIKMVSINCNMDSPSQLFSNIQNVRFGSRNNKYQHKANDLRNIIFKHKVKRIHQNFLKKLRRNSIYRPAQEQDSTSDDHDKMHLNFLKQLRVFWQLIGGKQGFSIGNIGLIIWSFINIFLITMMVFVFSIIMTFPQMASYPLFVNFRIVSIILYVVDMIMNFVVTRYEGGQYLYNIQAISSHYMKNGLFIDIISIFILPIDLLLNNNMSIVISLVAMIKLASNIKKLQKFQYLFINSSEKERYYGLIKVFITNFAIGHILSILLNLMASINETENWYIKSGIQHSAWYIKYIWGYYWGTNIMLTVGFGDISATNHYEAIILVFIETFSCVTLAYNISHVGALIQSIRANNESKQKQLKVFHRMCQQNFVNPQIQSKISNFIEQSYKIKESFENQTQDEVLKSLPKVYEREYRKQANRTLFDGLGFLSYMSKKTLIALAQEVQRKICHPEEVVIKKGNVVQFLILQKGRISLACRIISRLDGKQVEKLQVLQGEKPKVFSLGFIKNKIINYNVKSDAYSVLYHLPREQFMNCLRQSEMDYQLFCMMKDKDEYIIDENNLYECNLCPKEYHTKFQCSKLHYFPLKQNVALKYLHKTNQKQMRDKMIDRNKFIISSLKCSKQLKENQKSFIEDLYDKQYYKLLEQLHQFYKNQQINSDQQFTKTFATSKTFSKSQKVLSHIKSIIQDRTFYKLEELFQNKNNKLQHFWDFQIDVANNFHFYFRNGNPCELKGTKRRIKKFRSNLFGIP